MEKLCAGAPEAQCINPTELATEVNDSSRKTALFEPFSVHVNTQFQQFQDTFHFQKKVGFQSNPYALFQVKSEPAGCHRGLTFPALKQDKHLGGRKCQVLSLLTATRGNSYVVFTRANE